MKGTREQKCGCVFVRDGERDWMLEDFEAVVIDLPLELDTFEIHPDEFLRSGIFCHHYHNRHH